MFFLILHIAAPFEIKISNHVRTHASRPPQTKLPCLFKTVAHCNATQEHFHQSVVIDDVELLFLELVLQRIN